MFIIPARLGWCAIAKICTQIRFYSSGERHHDGVVVQQNEKMSHILDLPSWQLSTADLIQQVAQVAWLNKESEYKNMYELITGARVAYELWNRVSGQRELEMYQNQCIMGIVDYIKKNPRASEEDIAKAVQQYVAEFQAKVEAM